MTPKQKQLLDFIKSYMSETNGIAPSFDEMTDAIGLSSKSGVHRILTSLEEAGHITRQKNRARRISLQGGAS